MNPLNTFQATFVGSLDAFDPLEPASAVTPSTTLCVVGTAAAFAGIRSAFDLVHRCLGVTGARVVEVAAIDRVSANDESVVRVVSGSDLVVLCDGAVLHARSVWRGSALGDALMGSRLLAVGAVGSVLGETMIDPRGGAPTTGMGGFSGVVVSAPAGPAQTLRTMNLLGDQDTLVQLGPRAVVTFDGSWRVVNDRDLVITRAGEPAEL